MDELQLVRDFYPSQSPPDPDVVAAARALLGTDCAPPRRMRLAGAAHRRWQRAGRRVRLGVPAAAVTAIAALVAVIALRPATAGPAQQVPGPVAVPSFELPGSTGPGTVFALPPGAMAREPVGSARDTLLTAARSVRAGPDQAPARYYVTPRIVGNFLRVGPASDPYVMLEVVRREYWAASAPRDGSPDMAQALYLQAATSADRASWRRDGSPTVWKGTGQSEDLVDPAGGVSGWFRPLSASPGKPVAMEAGYGEQQFLVGGKDLTLTQLLQLPTDPAALKKVIVAGGLPPGGDATSYLLMTVPAVLQMPVTAAVRAGLYQVLAGLPGVQSLGAVTDLAGQHGEAVAYTRPYRNGCGAQISVSGGWPVQFRSCTVQQILVIDPGTGMPLAEELRYVNLPPGAHWSPPDGLFSYELFQTPFWTSHDRPGRPKN